MWGGADSSDAEYGLPALLSGAMAVAMITMLYSIAASSSLKFTYILTKHKFNNISPSNEHSEGNSIFNILIFPIILSFLGFALFLASQSSGLPLNRIFDVNQIFFIVLILLFSYLLPGFSIKSAIFSK